MTADQIRKMQWDNRFMEHQNLFTVLREIAAQLAEIKAEISKFGPVTAPDLSSQK